MAKFTSGKEEIGIIVLVMSSGIERGTEIDRVIDKFTFGNW